MSGATKIRTWTATGAGTTNDDIPIDEQSTNVNGTLIAVIIELTASGGTPTLDVKVQWSGDGVTFVDADAAVDSFAQITTAVGKAKTFTVKGAYARIVSVIAGTTPSFTGSLWFRVL